MDADNPSVNIHNQEDSPLVQNEDKQEPTDKQVQKENRKEKQLFTVEDAVEKLGFGPFQVLATIFAGLIWVADAMEVMLLSVLSPHVKCLWDLSESEEAAITSVVFIGFFFGAFFWGWVCDTIGRKSGLFIVNVNILVFGILSAIPVTSDPYAKIPSYPWLLLCRTGVGFGAGGAGQVVTYYAEFLPKRARGVCLTLTAMWWSIGSLMGAVLAIAVMVPGGLGWHWYLGLSTIPLFFALCCFPFIPESARFYIVKKKYKKAEKVIHKIAWFNRRKPPKGELVSNDEKERGESRRAKEEGSVSYSDGSVVISDLFDKNGEESPLLDETKDNGSQANIDDKADQYLASSKTQKVLFTLKAKLWRFLVRNLFPLFSDNMWKTTILLFFLWFGVAWLYYGIVLLTTQFLQNDPHCGYVSNVSNMTNGSCRFLDRDDYITIVWTSIAEAPGLLVTLVIVEIIGRKLSMIAEFLLTMAGFLLLFVCGERIVLTVFLFIIRAFATGVFQVVYLYTPEVYPTAIRGFALGICSSAARLGAIATPYVAQVLVEHSDLATISLYAGSCLVLTILAGLLPIETKGRALQDGRNLK